MGELTGVGSKITKTSRMQRLGYHRKGEREVSRQSAEAHLQRSKMGGCVPPGERKGRQLNLELREPR